MNIKTLLTDEERNDIANGISADDFETSVEYWDAIIEAENEAQNLKTKRAMVGWLEKRANRELFSAGLFQVVMPSEEWQEFKKWALGE